MEINGKVTATNYPAERLLERLYDGFSLIYYCVTRLHQLVLGFLLMCVALLLRPAANCTVTLLDLDFFSSFSLLQIAFPKKVVALSHAGKLTGLVMCSYSTIMASELV